MPLRLLLDAHLSRRIAAPLRKAGHDVLALSEERSLAALRDPDVVELAVRARRILVTANVKDYTPLLRGRAEGGRENPGCVLVQGIRTNEFGLIARGLERLFRERPRQAQWANVALVLSRSHEAR